MPSANRAIPPNRARSMAIPSGLAANKLRARDVDTAKRKAPTTISATLSPSRQMRHHDVFFLGTLPSGAGS